MSTFCKKIKEYRNQLKLPLRKVAAELDIDPSTLSKIERGERQATKNMIPIFALLFNLDENELMVDYLSDKVAFNLYNEKNSKKILEVAEKKITYLRDNEQKQSEIEF